MAKMAVQLKRTASTTLSVGAICADATRPRRIRVYDVMVGSEATPADNPFSWLLRRCTTLGTGTAVTPTNLDPASATTEADAAENHTVNPTTTANSELLDVPLNQRATFRWVAAPGGELIIPATASNGVVLDTPTSSAVVISAMIHVDEE